MGRTFDGYCRLCEEGYKGQGMTSHVKSCLAEHANLAAIHHGLLVGIRADGDVGRFWMYVMVRPEASLASLDAHLREAWLETDGAASVFDIDEVQYLSTVDEEEAEEAPVRSMDVDIGAVLRPRMEFDYLYDPLDPTQLELTVYDPYPCPAVLVTDEGDSDIVTVARNTVDGLECARCSQEAVYFCPECPEEEGQLACEDCRGEFEEALVEITNSPRL